MSAPGLPSILIVSVPKGGTNLLMQAILGIPGMVRTSENMLAKGNIKEIPPGEMGVMHLPYTRQRAKILSNHNVKILFISRDPRDIAVSMMHFIANGFVSHALYPAFNNYLTTNEDRLSAIINGVIFQQDIMDTVLANELLVAHGTNQYPNIDEFCVPFLPWKDSKSVCHVTFEELASNSPTRTASLKRMVNFMWDELSVLGIPKGLLITQMEQNINPAVSPTFRAGRVGDWKIEFTEKNKEDFKRVAGPTLIQLGYERDLLW